MTRAQSSTSDLVPEATYLSPSGRACRLAPGQEPLSRALKRTCCTTRPPAARRVGLWQMVFL